MTKFVTEDNLKSFTPKTEVMEFVCANVPALKDALAPLTKEKVELMKSINPVYHDVIQTEFYTKCMKTIAHLTSKETGIPLEEVYCAVEHPLALVDAIILGEYV